MENKKEQTHFTTTIGKELKNLLNTIKEKVNKYAYDALKISDYEAGEILARKAEEKGIFK